MADRREYAARYDAMAQTLYQIAIYTTGDALEARRAIAACFVGGFDAVSRGDDSFEAAMFRELCRCCGESPVLTGESYRRQLCETLEPIRPDERFSALLCDLEPWQREAILLAFFGGAADRLHVMIGRAPKETAQTLHAFFRLLSREKIRCNS